MVRFQEVTPQMPKGFAEGSLEPFRQSWRMGAEKLYLGFGVTHDWTHLEAATSWF
jgi:hypothetical protein